MDTGSRSLLIAAVLIAIISAYLTLIARQAGKAFKARGEGNAPFLRQLDVYAVEPEYMTGRRIRWRSQPAHE